VTATARREARRLPRQPGEVIDRDRRFEITWCGRPFPAYPGDTIVSALAASGVRAFSRSSRYHRPRGILTASFHDPGCTVQVGGEPNVRGAHRRAEPGMVVSPQGVWPSLGVDLKAVSQLVGPLMGAGSQYKTFMKPVALLPAYQQVRKRLANGGRLPADPRPACYDKRYAHPDVVVAGGGPAGMAAAVAAARAGAGVMLVEEEYELGGHLRWGGPDELAALAQLRVEVESEAGIEVLTNSVVTGRYEGNWLAIVQRPAPGGPIEAGGPQAVVERLVKARARSLVVAPGLIERPYVFEGNHRPGVMLSTAVRRLINLWAVKPGEEAVVLTANSSGDAAVADLQRAGVEVVRVVDARRGGGIVRALGPARSRRQRAREALGGGLEAVLLLGGAGGVGGVELPGGERLECDLLVTAVGWTAPTSLLDMAGDRPFYDERAARFLPGGRLAEGVLAAGGIAGDGPLDQMVEQARAIGRLAAGQRGEVPASPREGHPALFRSSTHGMVDYSGDVSSRDLVAAVREGYDSIELAKRYTTATMGPSQGKLEVANAVAVVAEATGRTMDETGTTVWRPPYAPISLGALAGPRHEPVRRSPMQAWHEAHGAEPVVEGQWVRPGHYGDPEAEVLGVRHAVGLMDVTPRGKLDLKGPDVPKLLDLVYANRWAGRAEGAVGYGVMCTEEGVVLDHGVTGRVGPAHYLMSTTPAGEATVWEWLESWLQTAHPEWKVHVTPLTAAFASIDVAGPRSRQLMERVVEGVDLSPEAFPHMEVRRGSVCGVPGCYMWRLGSTGELGYEVNVPASYGLFVWETLMDRGADLGVGAFGVEAQGVLLLEKGHLMVGQDTDGSTHPFAASLDWLVELDKHDFAGRPELVGPGRGGGHQRLVGLQPLDPALVPPEPCLIVEGEATISGRVTSSRRSPTLGRSICLGLVAPHLATPGTVVTVVLPDRTRVGARVMEHRAHFDPEGVRLRA